MWRATKVHALKLPSACWTYLRQWRLTASYRSLNKLENIIRHQDNDQWGGWDDSHFRRSRNHSSRLTSSEKRAPWVLGLQTYLLPGWWWSGLPGRKGKRETQVIRDVFGSTSYWPTRSQYHVRQSGKGRRFSHWVMEVKQNKCKLPKLVQ